jgi:glucose-6-phosphate 1-dehydrogenase
MLKMNGISPDNNFTLVIFGITGNLAGSKLIPALYDLAVSDKLPDNMQIIGLGRKKLSKEEFQLYILDILSKPHEPHSNQLDPTVVQSLVSRFSYAEVDFGNPKLYQSLREIFLNTQSFPNKIFYLATYPKYFANLFENLQKSGLNKEDAGWVRIMIEKPLGNDLKSAKQLNMLLSKYYVENQIYRLDHYLGKETLQNILTFRFGNSIFEHLMSHKYVDHIQITMAEQYGIGSRGTYYDSVGALKDVGQNHILQMIALTTMESPKTFSNAAVTKERIDLIKSLVPEPGHLVYGQYEGYQKEVNVKEHSTTDTFFAFRTHINNERFKGVPIYVRAGKNMNRTIAEVSFIFKNSERRLFSNIENGNTPNVLIYRIHPNEGIVLKFLSKVQGTNLKLEEEYLQYCYRHKGLRLSNPYHRLLVDAIRGDQTFFIDAPEVEAQWEFIDKLTPCHTKPEQYPVGSWGPPCADKLIQKDGRQWLEPSIEFCSL